MLKRSWAPVTTTKTGDGAACVGGGSSLVWQSPQYPEPGVYAFTDTVLVNFAFGNAKHVDAFLSKRAGGNPQKKLLLWEKMIQSPGGSAEYKALMFAGLLSAAKQNSRGVSGFEAYIRSRHSFVVGDAFDMYEKWKDIDAYKKYQAARSSSGISGVSTDVLGAAPPNILSYAWTAAVPDERGGAFLDAMHVLSSMAAKGDLGSAKPDPTAVGFKLSYLSPIYKGLDKALGQMDDWVKQAKSFSSYGTRGLARIGGNLAMVVVQSSVDLTMAILTLKAQADTEKQMAAAMADAKKAVSLKQMLNTDKGRNQLLLYWALATSPYNAGSKSGVGSLNNGLVCAAQQWKANCRLAAWRVAQAAKAAGHTALYEKAIKNKWAAAN